MCHILWCALPRNDPAKCRVRIHVSTHTAKLEITNLYPKRLLIWPARVSLEQPILINLATLRYDLCNSQPLFHSKGTTAAERYQEVKQAQLFTWAGYVGELWRWEEEATASRKWLTPLFRNLSAHLPKHIICPKIICRSLRPLKKTPKQLTQVSSDDVLSPAGGRWHGLHWGEELHPSRPESSKHTGVSWTHL